MSAWFSRHLQNFVGALGRLSQQPFANSLTVFVIGISLALPACLHVFVSNAQALGGNWNRALDISVYLKKSVDAASAERLADKLKKREDVAEVRLIEADDALKEFREYSGFGAALDALTDNPLPHVLVITPATAKAESIALDGRLAALATELRALPESELVQFDTAWVQRLSAMLDAARRAIVLIAVLLAVGVMVIVSNTIRLDIQNRRDEIEVAKLVGASNAFVRRPFLYSGFWYGLAGGLLAIVIVTLTVWVLSSPVQRIATLYGSAFTLQGLSPIHAAAVLAAGVAVGWLGSLIATNRHIRYIEPH